MSYYNSGTSHNQMPGSSSASLVLPTCQAYDHGGGGVLSPASPYAHHQHPHSTVVMGSPGSGTDGWGMGLSPQEGYYSPASQTTYTSSPYLPPVIARSYSDGTTTSSSTNSSSVSDTYYRDALPAEYNKGYAVPGQPSSYEATVSYNTPPPSSPEYTRTAGGGVGAAQHISPVPATMTTRRSSVPTYPIAHPHYRAQQIRSSAVFTPTAALGGAGHTLRSRRSSSALAGEVGGAGQPGDREMVMARDYEGMVGTRRVVDGRTFREYACTVCDKKFSRPSSLTQHHRSHTGERPFACPYQFCDMAFTTQSNLKRHIRKHEAQEEAELPPRTMSYYESRVGPGGGVGSGSSGAGWAR